MCALSIYFWRTPRPERAFRQVLKWPEAAVGRTRTRGSWGAVGGTAVCEGRWGSWGAVGRTAKAGGAVGGQLEGLCVA